MNLFRFIHHFDSQFLTMIPNVCVCTSKLSILIHPGGLVQITYS